MNTANKNQMNTPRMPSPAHRDRLLTPATYDKVLMHREASVEPSDAKDFASIRGALATGYFIKKLVSNTLVTIGFNILFSWGTLSTWNIHPVRPICLFHPTQPAGDKGAYTSITIDVVIATFIVGFMNTLSTWQITDEADLGHIGRLSPHHISSGIWRFVPKGGNLTRAIMSAVMFCILFGGAYIGVLSLIWAISGAGGRYMEIDGWLHILPKALWCGVECSIVYTLSYVVALTRCDRSQRSATLLKQRDSAVACTRIINWCQLLLAILVGGFTGWTYYFAFGGIQLGSLIGMWLCTSFMIGLSIAGLRNASASLVLASRWDLVYFFLMFLTFVGTLVCSGLCLIYAEQGIFIIRDNWQKIKVGILLPFTSEYDLQQTVTLNLQLLSGIGFSSSIILLIGVLHFGKRLGPGQNLILLVQSLNFVLATLGAIVCWLVADVSVITAYGAADGVRDLAVVMILSMIFLAVCIFIGAFVASGSRAPNSLSLYASFLLILAIPMTIFAIECFSNASTAEQHVLSHWDEIQQLLPRNQPIWTKCSKNDVTRCKEGVSITARANFQAVGWLAVTMATLGFMNGLLALMLRNWHNRFKRRQSEGFIADYEEEAPAQNENNYSSKRREKEAWTPVRTTKTSYGATGQTGGDVGIGIRSPEEEAGLYQIRYDNSQTDNLDSGNGHASQGGRQGFPQQGNNAASPRPQKLVRKGDIRWSFVSSRGLGVSLKTCCGDLLSPSRTLRRLLQWSRANPFTSFALLILFGTALCTGIAVIAFLVITRSKCALASVENRLHNYSSVFQNIEVPIPYACMCESTLTNADTWHPLDSNDSCAKYPPDTTLPPFYPTCYQIPRIQEIHISNEFTYGKTLIRTVNTTHPHINASLKLLGLDRTLHDQWLSATAKTEWLSFNSSNGRLEIDLQLPNSDDSDMALWEDSCASASLVLSLPISLQKVKVYTYNQTSGKVDSNEQLPFFMCISRQDQSVVPEVTGCIDLSVAATSVSVSVESESSLALSNLGKNGSSSQLFTDLLEEFPFGNINVKADYGNVIVESTFGTGEVNLSTSKGNIVMRNSFAKNLAMDSWTGSVEAVDIAAFAKILQIAEALNPKSATKLLPSDFGNIRMQSTTGDTIATGIFACDSLYMSNLEGGNPVASTAEIIGALKVFSANGDVYLSSVDTTSDISLNVISGNLHASALVTASFTAKIRHGSVSIIEMFMGSVFGLLPSLAPGKGTSSSPPKASIFVSEGDVIIEGLQGLKNPADASRMQVDISSGGGGKIKLLANANGFLGHYKMLTSEGKIGLEIEGNTPSGDWLKSGCVPLPSNAFSHPPPEHCQTSGSILLNSTYGDLEFIVGTGP